MFTKHWSAIVHASKLLLPKLLQRNKEVKPYSHKVIKYRDTISLVYYKDHTQWRGSLNYN
jgi:hypothetical protein